MRKFPPNVPPSVGHCPQHCLNVNERANYINLGIWSALGLGLGLGSMLGLGLVTIIAYSAM